MYSKDYITYAKVLFPDNSHIVHIVPMLTLTIITFYWLLFEFCLSLKKKIWYSVVSFFCKPFQIFITYKYWNIWRNSQDTDVTSSYTLLHLFWLSENFASSWLVTFKNFNGKRRCSSIIDLSPHSFHKTQLSRCCKFHVGKGNPLDWYSLLFRRDGGTFHLTLWVIKPPHKFDHKSSPSGMDFNKHLDSLMLSGIVWNGYYDALCEALGTSMVWIWRRKLMA